MRFISPEERGEKYVTSSEAAEMCGVTRATINQWVHRGYIGPVAVLAGTCAHLYDRADVVSCNESRTRGTRKRGLRKGFVGTPSDLAQCFDCDVMFSGAASIEEACGHQERTGHHVEAVATV